MKDVVHVHFNISSDNYLKRINNFKTVQKTKI